MQQLGNLISSFMETQLVPLAVTIIAVVIIICGFSFMLGQKGREWGKAQTFWTIIGAVLVYGGTYFAQLLQQSLQF